jgi:hypothetical protein
MAIPLNKLKCGSWVGAAASYFLDVWSVVFLASCRNSRPVLYVVCIVYYFVIAVVRQSHDKIRSSCDDEYP